VESDPLKIEVLPKPDHYPGEYWLPARRITLSQQISDAQGLRVGEPVTRTIILDAVGLEENMIEEPTWPEMKDARIYPDQPQGISRDDGKWVLGHKEYRYAVVPEQPGELVLPEIRLQWWDTTSNSSKIAVLPEHRVPVAASNLSPDIPNPTPSTALPGNRASPAEAGALWRWRMATYALALLWLGTLALHLRRSAAKSNGQVGSQGPSGEDALLDSMKRACREGDASRARQTFGQWVRRYGPPGAYGSLMEFAAVAGDDELSLAIHALDEGAFRDSDAPAWEGRLLWERFSAWLKSRGRGAAEPAVEPDLYAEGKARHGG